MSESKRAKLTKYQLNLIQSLKNLCNLSKRGVFTQRSFDNDCRMHEYFYSMAAK